MRDRWEHGWWAWIATGLLCAPVAAQSPEGTSEQQGEVEGAEEGADSLLDELARVELLLAARRDFGQAAQQLLELRRRAALIQRVEARCELLVRVAVARAELELARGEPEAARAALERLTGGGGEPGEEERRALEDPRLEALRQRIASGLAHPAAFVGEGFDQDEAAEIAGDPLLLRVHRALEEKDRPYLDTLGFSAVPALARLTELSLDRVVADPDRDPFVALVRMAELRAAEFALASYDRGGSFWRKRVLRTMRDWGVLTNVGTWDESVNPHVCREPQWIEIVERASADPELVRESLPLVGTVVSHGVLTPPMRDALVAALRSSDPDLSQAALRVLQSTGSPTGVLEPVYSAVLDHPDAHMRLFAATQLAREERPEALLAAVDHPDPAVRGQLQRWIGRHRAGAGAELCAILERLAVDDSTEVRRHAAITILRKQRETPGEFSEGTFRRLAADPDEEIRVSMAKTLVHPDAGLLEELLLALARDPAPAVRAAADERLVGGRQELPLEVRLALLRARRSSGEPFELFDKVAYDVAEIPAGVVEVARWAAESGDRDLLIAAASRIDRNEALAGALLELEPAVLASFVLEIGRFASREPDHAKSAAETLEAIAQRASRAEEPAVAAMRAVLDAPDAPLVSELRALQVLAAAGDERFEAELLETLRDPRWQGMTPDDGWAFDRHLMQAIGELAEDLAPEVRNARILAAVRDRTAADAPTLLLASDLDWHGPDAGELAQAILERWFAVEGEAHRTVSHALSLASRYPERVPAETLVRAVRVPDYAINAVTAMGKLRDPRFLPTLGECIEAEWVAQPSLRERVQMQTVWALTQYLSDDAAEVLLSGIAKSIADPVRQACFDAVDKISRYQEEKAKLVARRLGGHKRDEAVARVAALFDDADPRVRAEAARAAATLGAVELLPELIELLAAEEEGVRAAAREALDRLNSPPGGGEDG